MPPDPPPDPARPAPTAAPGPGGPLPGDPLPGDPLPVDAVLPAVLAALARQGAAVLVAPPGAGKTTRLPLALLRATPGRILMLEPRRLAARAAAERLADTLGERVGGTVGYRIRGEAAVSAATRIEVVTEGILTRMIQADPGLSGVGAVVFDEFHERSIHADLGLALVLEARAALRPDLAVVVMSATLDPAPVAALLGDAEVVLSEGRAFPVETRWLPRPLAAGTRLEAAMADLVAQAVAETPEGGVLAFLPGEGEIRRVAALLAGRLPGACTVQPLYGAMAFAQQRAALAPLPAGRRKVVLATAIAETSLTIADVRVVVDAGRARRARFDPGSGLTRLVTERASRAEAEQRRGRAGRVAPGLCYRLWARAEDGAMAPRAPAEIETADLAGLALDLALWGSDAGLAFLTPPPAGALAEARALLEELGALAGGRITDHGRAMAALPLHPRLAHMLVAAGPQAAPRAALLAALLAARDPLSGAPPDLGARLLAVADARAYRARHPWPADAAALARIRAEAARLTRLAGGGDRRRRAGGGGAAGYLGQDDAAGARRAGPGEGRGARASGGPEAAAPDGGAPDGGMPEVGMLAALAYPDRIGLRRAGDAPRWVLSGGRGAVMEPGTPLAGAGLIVATDLDGAGAEARVRQAAGLSEAALRALFGARIAWHPVCRWSRREGRVVARREERLGALVLAVRAWPEAPPEARARAALEGLADELRQGNGLPMSPAAARLRAQAEQARAAAGGGAVPPVDDASLMAAAADWLLPALEGVRTRADLRALDLAGPLRRYLGPAVCARLEALYPADFATPLGRRVPIDHAGDAPAAAVRVQEVFGMTEHPVVGPERVPLRLTLLSPGGKPIAVTADLPGFWAGAWAEVRRDMRGRYPRHAWPEDPTAASPTLRAKPRGT